MYHQKTHPCPVCQRPDAQLITDALVNGEPVTWVAKRFSVTAHAVTRHRDECVLHKVSVKPNEMIIKFSKFTSKDLPRCRYCKTLCADVETLKVHQKFCRGKERTRRQPNGALVRGRRV